MNGTAVRDERETGERAGRASVERALVERARAGDRAAYGTLAASLAPLLAAFAARHVAGAADAADVAQASLLRGLETLPSLEDPARFRGWLYAIALNECRRRHRGLVRLRRAYERWRERRTGEAARASPPGEPDEAERVRAAVSRLPERQRLAVELRLWEGLSVEDAARALGCTEGTVKANLHHALAKLREALGRPGDLP